jgi:spore coat polysaccharide biosynthesis protein SpsF
MKPDDVAIVVQARMSSTRLPGKVVAPLAGEPAIVRMMERAGRVTRAAHHVVATSEESSDDPLAHLCHRRGIACVRGPLDDVLGRVVGAVPGPCSVVVRLTGDCPLVDPALVDRHIAAFAAGPSGTDYVTNVVMRTYPDGLDVEVMSREVLAAADRAASDPFDREHVTPWIQRHARVLHVTQAVDLSALRWVLDTPSDYESIAAVYATLHPVDSRFGSPAVYRLLAGRPDLIRVAGDTPLDEIVTRIRALLAAEPIG